MLSQSLRGYSLILASASPRRAQFLKDLGLPFEVRVKETDEHYPQELKGAEIPLYIAQEKAHAFSGEIAEKEILITADTLIWFEGKAIGKPKDFYVNCTKKAIPLLWSPTTSTSLPAPIG